MFYKNFLEIGLPYNSDAGIWKPDSTGTIITKPIYVEKDDAAIIKAKLNNVMEALKVKYDIGDL